MLRNSIGGVILLFLLFSCKSLETIKIGEVSKITDAKLRIKLHENEVEFNKLYLKKVQFTFNDGKVKKSFKGSFVIQKDSQIIVSIYALMGIELIRARLTKDSVIILDKHNKIALKTNYGYFENKYGINLDYNSIEAILSNSLFLYPSERDYYEGLKKYKHHIRDNHYSFNSLKDKKLGRLNKRSKNNIIVNEINIYPEVFRIFKVYIKDFAANQSININYNNFKKFDSFTFPSDINFSAIKGNLNLKVSLKINYLVVDDGGSLHFKIPSSYDVKEL